MRKFILSGILVFIILLSALTAYSDEDNPMKDFEKKYGKYKKYYERWKNFVPERDYQDPPEIDYYLNLEKQGKLPPYVTIYHDDSGALPEYRAFLMSQLSDLKLIEKDIAALYYGIVKYHDKMEWYEVEGEYAKLPTIPFIDFNLWMLKEYEGTNTTYTDPTGLCLAIDYMLIAPSLFPEEIKHAKEKVFPYFRQRIESGEYHPLMFKILYLYENDQKALLKAFEIAKRQVMYFTMWGKDYCSYKRKKRIVVKNLKLKPHILKLLNSGKINETTQYDALVYLSWIKEIPNNLSIVFRILDNQWFGFSGDAEKYLDFLWDVKDERIKEYFIKNKDKPIFEESKIKMEEYIKNFNSMKTGE